MFFFCSSDGQWWRRRQNTGEDQCSAPTARRTDAEADRLMPGVNDLAASAKNAPRVWQLKQTAQWKTAITQGQTTRRLVWRCSNCPSRAALTSIGIAQAVEVLWLCSSFFLNFYHRGNGKRDLTVAGAVLATLRWHSRNVHSSNVNNFALLKCCYVWLRKIWRFWEETVAIRSSGYNSDCSAHPCQRTTMACAHEPGKPRPRSKLSV